MQTTSITYRLGLLAIALAYMSGCCARWHQIPDDCADALYECEFAQVVHNLCQPGEPLSCASPVECCDAIECDVACPIDTRDRIIVGPPAVRYRPPMPPKFLTLPTRPILIPVNLEAPSHEQQTVEVDFGSQLAFPGRD